MLFDDGDAHVSCGFYQVIFRIYEYFSNQSYQNNRITCCIWSLNSRFVKTFWQTINSCHKFLQAMAFLKLIKHKTYPKKHPCMIVLVFTGKVIAGRSLRSSKRSRHVWCVWVLQFVRYLRSVNWLLISKVTGKLKNLNNLKGPTSSKRMNRVMNYQIK